MFHSLITSAHVTTLSTFNSKGSVIVWSDLYFLNTVPEANSIQNTLVTEWVNKTSPLVNGTIYVGESNSNTPVPDKNRAGFKELIFNDLTFSLSFSQTPILQRTALQTESTIHL